MPGDAALGDPLAASYNDVDPYRGTAVTNASPGAVSDGTSGGSFHGWTTTPDISFVDKIVKPQQLGLTKRVDDSQVQAGELVTYVIRVTNPSKRAVRNVRTCDHLPAGLVAVRATPKVRVSKGQYCWTAKRIGAGKTKRYELTTRTLPGAAGRTVNKRRPTPTRSGAPPGSPERYECCPARRPGAASPASHIG